MVPACQVDGDVMLNGAAAIPTPESLNTVSELGYYFLKYDNSKNTAITGGDLSWLTLSGRSPRCCLVFTSISKRCEPGRRERESLGAAAVFHSSS